MDEQIKRILLAAVAVVHDRGGDVDTEDGSFATTSIDSIIELEAELAEEFCEDSDDVIYHKVVAEMKRKYQ